MKILKCFQDRIITFWKWIKQNFIFILKKIKQFIEWIKNRINATLFITLFITLIATVLGGWAVDSIIKEENFRKFRSKPFLTFESDYTQVFRLSKEVDSLEYSVGESEWQNLKTENIVFGGSCGKLLLRGNSKNGTEGATIIFGTDAKVICTGDVYSLVNYRQCDDTLKKDSTSCAKFNSLFENCKQLIVAPKLSSKVLAENCYENMFSGCTSLKRAPELPAEILKERCYSNMFAGCTSLEEVPLINAKKLAAGCCSGMFKGCTSLGAAPELMAERMAKNCYSNMFEGCSSLNEAPVLPALELASGCYSSMFNSCTSLKKAPELRAEKLAELCYNSIFAGCSSLSIVKVWATKIDYNQIQFWLLGTGDSKEGVSVSRFFYKNKNAEWDDRIIPQGWTIMPFDPNPDSTNYNREKKIEFDYSFYTYE